MSSTSFVPNNVLQGIHVIWCTNTVFRWSSSWGHTIDGLFRHLGTNDTWAWYKSYSNHIFDWNMLKISPRWSKWTLGSPNLESGQKSYASGKITDTALSSRSAWHRPAGLAPPQISLHSVSWPWGLTNSPLTQGRQARSETKTERPHMSLQWAPKVATRCWAYHPRLDLQ